MFAKIKLIWEIGTVAVSLFKKAKEAYKRWKISRIEKAIQKRKDHVRTQVANIKHEASQEPTEESDEKLKEYFRKLYSIDSDS